MNLNFKVSDEQKFNAIWTLLNDKYNEEGGWLITYGIQDIYDDYALVFSYEDNCYYRVNYTKDNETDTVALGEKTKCYFIDVTESEKAIIDRLRETVGSYELIEENYNNGIQAIEEKENLAAQIEEYSTKISELENKVATLNTDKENAENNFNNVNQTLSTLTDEVEALRNYKVEAEKAKKMAIISSYSELLSNEIIEEFTEKLDEYENDTALDMAMAYELKKSNLSAFTKNPTYVPKVEDNTGSLTELISKYKK
jgi:outer membrane murein-binding lipoprotein Lpp